MITIYTIGFTKKSAKDFFNLLKNNKVNKLIDTRINNTSQLAGFAKGTDLNYFLNQICNISYEHQVLFAPTKELLSNFRGSKMTWEEYEIKYLNLLDSRKIIEVINIDDLNNSCLLCSEHTPEHCHRRLLVEYLQKNYNNIEVKHLV